MYILGFFILVHGLIHLMYLAPMPNDSEYPFNFQTGWLNGVLGEQAVVIGTLLMIAVSLAFIVAALAAFGTPGLDHATDIAVIGAAVLSLVLLLLFWHPWLMVGMTIDILLIFGAYRFGPRVAS
jgi:hypothetical protein